MSTVTVHDEKLEGLLKEALIEVLEEEPDVFWKALVEAVEDVGLAEAIRQGRDTATVGRDTVLKVLE